MSAGHETAMGVDLALESDFVLGSIQVRPSAGRILIADRTVRVEPRVMQVLVLLVRAAGGTVTRDTLVALCWGGRIVSDDAVSRIIAKVRALARLTDPPAFALETVPKVGFQLIVADTAATAENQPSRPIWLRRPRALAATVAILALVCAGLVWRIVSLPIPPHQNGRVEVVAFEALQSDAQTRRLASTMSAGIVRGLARAGIETAPAAVPKADGPAGGGAEFRITGTVERPDGRATASVQLLDSRSGLVLWSMWDERPAGAVAGFEDATGEHVASVLQCMLEDRRAYPTVMDAATLGNYFNGCEAMLVGAYPRAVEFARRLVRQRPDLPGPHAVYAIALNHIAWSTDDEAEAEALRREARASARKALDIHPRYAEAYQALAISHPYGRDWGAREDYVQRARALDPNFTPAHLYYISILRETGRVRRARAVAAAAVTGADPRLGGALFEAIQLRAEMDGAAAALSEVNRVRDPGMARALRRQIALWHLPPSEGRATLLTLFEPHHAPPYRACLDKHLAAVERPPVRGLPAECARLPRGWRIRMLARQGDLDGAFVEANRPEPASSYTTVHFFQPELKAFRADPRFMPLANRLGLVDFWRSTGRWPDFCSEPDLPYDCRAVAAGFATDAARKHAS